jgi:translocation and assembly module TamB
VTGEVKLAWQEGEPLNLSDVTLAGADYTVRTRGRVEGLASGLALDGRVMAEAQNLARFSALAGRPLAGRAEMEAAGRGSLLGGDLELEGWIGGDGLRVGQPQVDALLTEPARIAFSVARGAAGTEIRSLDLAASSLSVGLSGWIRSAGSDLTAEFDFRDLSRLGGGYRGTLNGQARLTGTPETGSFTLEAQADGLAVGQPEADRILRGKSSVSAAIRTEGGALRIDRIVLENPQVSVRATGRAGGTGREVDIAAKLADLGLLLPEFPGPLTVTGTAAEQGGAMQLDLRAQGPGRIDAQVAGSLRGTRADLGITGTAQAALANPFIAPRTVSGPLRFDLRLNGPVSLQSLSGRVSLSEGRLAAPFLHISLQGITAEAVLAQGRATVTADAASSAGGRIGVSGTIGLAPPFQGDLTVTPRALVLRDPELYETQVNGDIRVVGPLAGGARISGAITLPETEIRVPSTMVGGAGAIPDLQHRNEPAAVRITRERAGILEREARERARPSRPFALDLVVNAPSRVFVRGRGLDAELGGTLRLGGTTAAVVPSGGIDLIRGRLDILGRRLDLTEAQLRVEGSLDPSLRVVASNSSEGITSSVTIEGRISQPEITFTSVPELPEEEVLAHLLFGRNLTSLSPFQAVQLANAVATLAGRGGEGIIGRLRRGFGLDDLDFATDSAGGTSVRLGRYISEKVYTDVTVGSEGTTQLNLNLDVRPGVTVRGSADSQGNTGFGVFVERDY